MTSPLADPPSSSTPPAVQPHSLINLALQGGGSHGAFTWGVLDTLLADGRVRIEGVSGTSAGAINAVAMAQGFAEAGSSADIGHAHEAARATLARVWQGVARLGSLGAMTQGLMRMLLGSWPGEQVGAHMIGNAMSQWLSPYQANPLDINPLRQLLESEIDFDAIGRLSQPRVFVSATHVRTGRAEIFAGRRLTLSAVMASACLPMMFQAVEIDGEHYWDGGFSGNPSLLPLINACRSSDIVLVQINPLKREHTPQSPHEIMDRVNELTFNASLLSQMRTIDFINRLLADGRLQEGEKYRSMLLHRIDGGTEMEEIPASTKLSADGVLIDRLFAMGQESARHWLGRHFADLGQRSTIDIRRDYVGAMPRGF
ncbi:MAG: patatin-like phospholipase family protein [Burkholderiales bacterium]|nr:patatin-like phospholipase family protein [Burkholderiales bacterium]